MRKPDVRIVELEPLRVASFYGFGSSPELEAWAKLTAWAGPRGLLPTLGRPRIFGFDNPGPAPGSPNYGYEFWLELEPGIEPDDETEVKTFAGGLYAVARCEVRGDPYDVIPSTWKKLVQWAETSRYQMARHQWLEEHVETDGLAEGEFVLNLYLPIAEQSI